MTPDANNPPANPSVTRRAFLLVLMLSLLVIPVALLPVHTLNPVNNSKQLVARVLMAIAGFVFVTYAAVRGLRRPDFPQVAILLFIAANLVSCLLSGKPGICFFEGWYLWAYAAVALAICQIRPTLAEYSKTLMVIVAAGVITALYGLSVYFGFDPLRSLYPFAIRPEEGRNYIHSFLGNPEYFGGYMAALAVLAFSRSFCRNDRMITRLAWIGLSLFFLLCLLLSGTRGALIGFTAGAAVMLVSELPRMARVTRRRIYWLVSLFVVMCAAVMIIFSFPNRLNYRNMRLLQRFAQITDVNSASVRERIFFFSVSSELIRHNPAFGTGPATFRLSFYPGVALLNERDDRAGVRQMAAELQSGVAEHAHNDYLEFWTEIGTVGIATLLLILSLAAYRFINPPAAARTKDSTVAAWSAVQDLALLRTAFFAAALCIFLNAAFSFPLHLPVRALLAWVLVGCFFAIDRSLRTIQVESDSPAAS